MLELLHSGPKPQIDETAVRVLKGPGRDDTDNTTTTSYLWVARGGPPEAPVVYSYDIGGRC